MYVSNNGTLRRDPLIARLAGLFRSAGASGQVDGVTRALLIAGAPGFGKSSMLSAVTRLISRRNGDVILRVSGRVIASEGHLARLLLESSGSEAGRSGPSPSRSLESVFASLCGAPNRRVLLAVDDVDALLFKREQLARLLARTVVVNSQIRLVATCHPAARNRLTSPHHPFASQIGMALRVTTLEALNENAATALLKRRAPQLPSDILPQVIRAAGGHPAALVYLGRLAELWGTGETWRAQCAAAETRSLAKRVSMIAPATFQEFLERASEFAGAIYAEPWSALGPQQRAILWSLASSNESASAAAISERIELTPSHVSAQLTRLVDDGLVRRTHVRGQFALAPLLSSWIVGRATPELPGSDSSGRGRRPFQNEGTAANQRSVAPMSVRQSGRLPRTHSRATATREQR
jgi:DNA-binding transcriptional ArsR family regulator